MSATQLKSKVEDEFSTLVDRLGVHLKGFEPTIQQKAIYCAFADPQKPNLLVRARAGTGKTSTVIQGLVFFPPREKVALVAFNTKNAKELGFRISEARPVAHCEAKTLHSLGFSFVRDNWSKVRLNKGRGWDIARDICGHHQPDCVINAVKNAVSFAKGARPFTTVDDIKEIIWDRDLYSEALEKNDFSEQDLINACLLAMERAKKFDGGLDFDDMIWLPVVHGWAKPEFDTVIVDECQDMNQTQITLALKASRKRVIVVGDDRQAIYAFRGADSGSLDRLKQELDAQEYGLNVTFRCPLAIVRRAQALVPDFQAHEGAIQGEEITINRSEVFKFVKPGNAIISRKNAPLMPLCLNLLKNGVRAFVEGRDIGANLANLVKKVAGKTEDMGTFENRLNRHEDKHLERLQKANGRGMVRRMAEFCDKVDCIRALAEDLASVTELLARIKNLFEDRGHGKRDKVCLSSIHKAKGMEFKQVFGLEWTINPTGDGGEEDNLAYVLWTRTQETYFEVREDAETPPVS